MNADSSMPTYDLYGLQQCADSWDARDQSGAVPDFSFDTLTISIRPQMNYSFGDHNGSFTDSWGSIPITPRDFFPTVVLPSPHEFTMPSLLPASPRRNTSSPTDDIYGRSDEDMVDPSLFASIFKNSNPANPPVDLHDQEMSESASPSEEFVQGPAKKTKNGCFMCPVGNCGKNYRRRGDLKFHVLEKHPSKTDLPLAISQPKSSKDGKVFPCPLEDCKCGFKWERDLRRHIKNKHQELASDPSIMVTQAKKTKAEKPVSFNGSHMAQWQVIKAENL